MICSLCLVSQRKITHNSAILAKYISILLLSDYRYCLSPSHRVPTLQSLIISTYCDITLLMDFVSSRLKIYDKYPLQN